MNDFTIAVTDVSFESEVIQSIRPVLVYFWADWSEECRYMTPIIDAVAKKKRATIQFAFLDVDANPRMAKRWAIAMVPTMILFVSGKERERIEGVTNEVHLASTINMHLEDADEEIDIIQ